MSDKQTTWVDSWHVNSTANKNYEFIDGLRGIAILLVLIRHILYVNPLSQSPFVHFMGGLLTSGDFGVPIFFALSGFLISWPFWKRKLKGESKAIPPGYGWRRFWKIYPPLAASILIFTPVAFYRHGDWADLECALNWLAGVPVLIPMAHRVNPVTWTLVVEVQFYILLPLFFLCLKRVSARMCLWTIPGTFLLAAVFVRWFVYAKGTAVFPSMLDSFAFGIFIAGLECMQKIEKRWARLGDVGFVLFALVILGNGWVKFHPSNFLAASTEREILYWMAKIASAFFLCYLADPQHPRARLLCQPWLRWLGLISYEVYILHWPINMWIREAFGSTHGNIGSYLLVTIGSITISILVGAIAYKKFSLPILKAGRNKYANSARVAVANPLVGVNAE